ncbi:MAG: GFA family protein [Erythrobacter sp.]
MATERLRRYPHTVAPLRLSVCHCRACQQRAGSAFSAQVCFPVGAVTVQGDWREWVRTADSGHEFAYRFCPSCGLTVSCMIDAWPELIAVPVGLFDEADFPHPAYSICEKNRQSWASITGTRTRHHP